MKKIMSLVLAMSLMLSLAVPAFAADIEPYANRYYTVYEYSSPNYVVTQVRNFTVDDYETMLQGQRLQADILIAIAAVIPGAVTDLVTIRYATAVAASLELLYTDIQGMGSSDVFFTITVSQRYRYQYSVDSLDTSNRRLVATRLYSEIETSYADGTTDVEYHEINLK